MNELLSGTGAAGPAATDPDGSLIDAEMGVYYTWLNQQRLPPADQSRFLVWLENQSLAVLISPGQKRASVDSSPTNLTALLQKVFAA
jgi:hypothetical protein